MGGDRLHLVDEQGEELGLGEVQDIPDELRQDPIWTRTGGTDPGRDGSRVALRLRRAEPSLGDGPLTWLPSPDGALAFDRKAGTGPGVRSVANLSAGRVALPPHAAVLLASGPLENGLLPPDTAVWLRL